MKLNFITVIRSFYVFLLVVALNSCKVHREVQKQSSHVDSTATSSKEVAKGSAFLQQFQNNRLDSSHTNGQNIYQRQIIAYQFAPDTNGRKVNELENRLTGITVTTEHGTQAMQTGTLTRQNTDLLNIAKDSSKSGEKKNTVVKKAADAKQSVTTRRVGSSLWLIILLLIIAAVIVLWKWKGRQIVAFIKAVRKVLKDGMPSTPA